jgi:hypothetical protein
MSNPRIPNVDADAIRESLRSNLMVQQLEKAGAELLARTNRPNVITLEQFEPYRLLFADHKGQYVEHSGPNMGRMNNYTRTINELHRRWVHELGINLYEVTYVIRSQEHPEVVHFIDRTFTRVHSDALADGSRTGILANTPRNAADTRQDLLMGASFTDLVAANQTEEQMKRTAMIRMESSIVVRHFIEENLSPDKRAKILADQNKDNPQPTADNSGGGIELMDDDD